MQTCTPTCRPTHAPQLGYLNSWSAYQTYRKQRPGEPDPLVGFRQQLLAALGGSEVRTQVCVLLRPCCLCRLLTQAARACNATIAQGGATQLSVDFPITLLLCTDPTPLS